MKTVGLIEPRELPPAFPCPVCGREYKTEPGLKAHIEKEHPDHPDKPPEGE